MANSTLVINVDVAETRVALVEDGALTELFIERTQDRSPVGNIYLGKVTRVLPGMQAAFIDIGLDRAAFLHVEDVVPQEDMEALASREDGDDDDDDSEVSAKRSKKRSAQKVTRATPIREVLTEGQPLMVQVSKGPIGTKGARVTSHISMPGRYVVYLPTVDHIGISKRIGNERERKRLRESIEAFKPPHGGFIVRTMATGLTKKQLKADVGYLVRQWEKVMQSRAKVKTAPALLYEDLDITLRAARDHFTESIAKITIDSNQEYERLREFLGVFLPERANDVELYDGRDPIFDEYGIEDEISRALSRKVPLSSGGYLIIDQAEALTAIDVNTGRFTGKGRDVEETICQTNLEAVKEIAYQLRFRNIGGLIVLDFIDMERAGNRDKVYKALVNALKKDRATTTITRISELGLVEMTRKRTRESLGRTLYEPCFYCDGTGVLQSKATICHEIIRQIRREKDTLAGYKIEVHAHPAICDMLKREHRKTLEVASTLFTRQILVKPHREYHLEQFDLNGA
ncbi:MAG: Rne/Rng family ribonuclease [Myxococcales bacterium]|nr:Rne/Rng family ribonuclease [Myxococcales bacterium]MDD9971527.1 Rne/Rng family ribonuclease [Myxococcales bacterium]